MEKMGTTVRFTVFDEILYVMFSGMENTACIMQLLIILIKLNVHEPNLSNLKRYFHWWTLAEQYHNKNAINTQAVKDSTFDFILFDC